jgi:hypothetical protein
MRRSSLKKRETQQRKRMVVTNGEGRRRETREISLLPKLSREWLLQEREGSIYNSFYTFLVHCNSNLDKH